MKTTIQQVRVVAEERNPLRHLFRFKPYAMPTVIQVGKHMYPVPSNYTAEEYAKLIIKREGL